MKSGTWTRLWGQCIECAAMKRYLQYAAEQGSNLIRSFWYGKFLQTVPNDALLSCKATQALVQPVDNQRKSVSHAPGPNKQPHLMDVQRALKSMQSCESALSPTVYDLVVKSVDRTDSMEQFPHSVLRRDCTLEWSEVATFLGNDVLRERRDYSEGGRKCAALARHVAAAVMSQPGLEWGSLLAWTSNSQLLVECLQLLQSSAAHPEHAHLCILLSSAAMERALGDVYLAIAKSSQCPSLLRDLLNTKELEDTFGPTAMCCLRCLIGPPSGLNLRNVLWHGFPSTNEISPDYGYLLLAITATLGRTMAGQPELEVSISHRSPVTFPQESVMAGLFPEITEEDLSTVEQLFTDSFFVLPTMLPLWTAALRAFKEGRYHHSLVLMLPGLEHGLRRVFACVNHCPHRVLTAESTVLYTTFDEMLSPTLPDGSPNSLKDEIGAAKLECLLDMLVHPEGPRLRDRISHGEVEFYSLPKTMASHTLSLAALFCAQYCLDSRLHTKHPIDKGLAIEKSYVSLFHPLSLLRRELLGLLEQLETWSDIPLPDMEQDLEGQQEERDKGEEEEELRAGDHVPSSLTEFAAAMERAVGVVPQHLSPTVLPLLEQLVRLSCCDSIEEGKCFSLPLRGLISCMWDGHVSTLHSPRLSLELAGVMRRAVANAHRTAQQVRGTASLRHRQHQQKQLRSRQRRNYDHLLTSLPTYRAALSLMVVVVVASVSCLPPADSSGRKLIRFHKKVLQFSENLFSQTSPSKNRWEEADRLCHSLADLDMGSLCSHTQS